MAELATAGGVLDNPGQAGGSLLAPLTNPAGGPPLDRAKNFLSQSPIKKALPWFAGVATLGAGALAWSTLAPAPQRVLYTQLDDGERASVVAALDKGNIHYKINSDTGALTVDEPDVYKARMLVAQNGSLALPDAGASDGLDKLPMGASRAMENERLRGATEHELMLSIKEIDGVQAVRVHLAEGEKSVFVRDTIAPTASVMLRLADGRQLSEPQVRAIVNLVAGSVPGLTPDAVKVVDQHGRLLTDKASGDDDRLEMQARMEEKLQGQVSSLLIPMLGDGNFTSEIQVNLDMDQVTSARETYDKQGVVRAETSQQSQQSTPGQAAGIPGALSNSPPPQAQPSPGAPKGTPAPAASGAPTPTATETSGSKTYELGEVAVSNQGPGKVKRLSVAVALSAKAMAKYKPQDIDQIKQLVSAAVGADPARGDQVAVFVRSFDPPAPPEKTPFYEAAWFGTVLHYGVPLIGLILVLLLAVRPLVNAWLADRKARTAAAEAMKAEAEAAIAAQRAAEQEQRALEAQRAISGPAADAIEYIEGMKIDAAMIGRQVGIAQQIVAQKPDNAVIALRQMLRPEPEPEG